MNAIPQVFIDTRVINCGETCTCSYWSATFEMRDPCRSPPPECAPCQASPNLNKQDSHCKFEHCISQVKGVILYDIGGNQWTVDLKSGTGSVASGKGATPDVTLSASVDDFLALASGKLNPQQAFMRGKLKIKGNMAIAMKLNSVLEAARNASGAAGKPPAAPAAAGAGAAAAKPAETPLATTASASTPGPVVKSQALFDAIGLAVRSDGAALVKKVNGIIQFNINGSGSTATPAAVFVLNLKTGAGSLSKGAPPSGVSPDLTLTISDDDFVALSEGKLNPQTVSDYTVNTCCVAWSRGFVDGGRYSLLTLLLCRHSCAGNSRSKATWLWL